MRNAIVIVVVVLLGAYGLVEFFTMHKRRAELQERVTKYLAFVDEHSLDSVRQDLIKDAATLGIRLRPDHIHITYEDTDIRSAAQKLVGQRLGAQYTNKRVVITIEYQTSVAGLPWSQTVSDYAIRQIAAPVLPPRRDMQELLDTP
jgi:hypothetical protein